MNRFIFKILIFSFFPLVTLFGVFLAENGRADGYYKKFTTPKQTSLILGNSKGGQGIVPKEMEKHFGDSFQGGLYNFCFTLYSSPYGQLYLEAIKKKIKDNTTDGIFILTVDPWSISGLKEDPENTNLFDEEKLFLKDMKRVDTNPNIFYLYKHYQKSFYEILLQRLKPGTIKLHEDGWLESEDISDKDEVQKLTDSKIEFYKNYASERTISNKRIKYLKETIEYLKSKGEIYLVRLPVTSDMQEVEDSYCPEFNTIFNSLAEDQQVNFKDFNIDREGLFFEDGLHLDTKSSYLLSKKMGQWIYFLRQNQVIKEEFDS